MKKGLQALLIAGILFSCSSLSKEEKTLIGKWQARWTSTGDWMDSNPGKEIFLEMDGRMEFGRDHRITIEGYGYPGCIFSQDTIKNTMTWELDQRIIRLYNEADSFIMAYQVEEIKVDTLQFIFLEDIEIELIKIK